MSLSAVPRGSSARPLAHTAKSSYLHFIWGMSFGVVAVLATPFMAVAALVLSACKSTHETVAHMWQ